jgi:hypothetical protein
VEGDSRKKGKERDTAPPELSAAGSAAELEADLEEAPPPRPISVGDAIDLWFGNQSEGLPGPSMPPQVRQLSDSDRKHVGWDDPKTAERRAEAFEKMRQKQIERAELHSAHEQRDPDNSRH